MTRCRFSSPTDGPCGFDYHGWTDANPGNSNVSLDFTTSDVNELTSPNPFSQPLYFDQAHFGGSSDTATLEKAVCQGPPNKPPTPTPVIVGVQSQCHPDGTFPNHYVLVTGEIVDSATGQKRFQIADPAGPGPGAPAAKCSNGNPIVTGQFLDGSPYNNHYVIIGSVTDPQTD